MKRLFFWILVFSLSLLSCKEKKSANPNKQKMENEFISRVHTTNFEADLYQLLGKTDLSKHISDFEEIDWRSDYKKEFNSMNFNMPDLEVLSKADSKYLSVSIAPNTEDSFQFVIGYGVHQESNNSNSPNRKVKLYMTESENSEIAKKYFKLFFERDFDAIDSELNKLYLMDEIEDVYINKE